MAQIGDYWPQIYDFKGENSAKTAQIQKNMEGYLPQVALASGANGLALPGQADNANIPNNEVERPTCDRSFLFSRLLVVTHPHRLNGYLVLFLLCEADHSIYIPWLHMAHHLGHLAGQGQPLYPVQHDRNPHTLH